MEILFPATISRFALAMEGYHLAELIMFGGKCTMGMEAILSCIRNLIEIWLNIF